ncbi:hypothetical protein Bca4012_032388 [Brassica carinata]
MVIEKRLLELVLKIEACDTMENEETCRQKTELALHSEKGTGCIVAIFSPFVAAGKEMYIIHLQRETKEY